MEQKQNPKRIVISGGGTGGHIFPAIAIADALRRVLPDAEILFIGAKGRMEMDRVPKAGYPIEGLWISGFKRELSFDNLSFPLKLISSSVKARRILRHFRPDVAIGVGGFASGPTLRVASSLNVPIVIQEQNSYPGITNKLMCKKAHTICVAYDGLDRWFPAEKIVMTGNPLRNVIQTDGISHEDAARTFNLDPSKPIVLLVGGSQGALGINKGISAQLESFKNNDVQMIWQTGKFYIDKAMQEVEACGLSKRVKPVVFIDGMDKAYAAADVVISRAGAISISELAIVQKPVIFVPLPTAAEDHQTKNAQRLVDAKAAMMILNSETEEKLLPATFELLNDKERCAEMSENIKLFARPNAADDVAKEILKILFPKSKEIKIENDETSTTMKDVYFLGIGGIGMSALARYCKAKGFKVSGYDRTPSPLTHQLEKEGIKIHYDDDPAQVPENPEMVVYTPAIPAELNELRAVKEHNYRLLKRSELLGMISMLHPTIAVAGTHGKTSTTALVAHILLQAKKKISAFIGGIAKNINSNVVIGTDHDEFVVTEADEFDRSFLTLQPSTAIITSIDADHLDIYGDERHLHDSFNEFADKIEEDGLLVLHEGLDVKCSADVVTYGLNDADVVARDIHVEDGKTCFTIVFADGTELPLSMSLHGLHNVENATAAVIVARHVGVNDATIIEALSSFKGVERRFDIRVENADRVFVDDYAHHPEEIRATIKTARQVYPERRLTLMFQPHLYSRTRDFMRQFAEVLSTVDQLILLEIYPAREKPIDGVSSTALAQMIQGPKVIVCNKDEAIEIVKELNPELLVTMGAGDISRLVPKLEEIMKK